MNKAFSAQKGSAIIYILIAIGLLAALTASLLDSPSQQTQAQNRMKTMSEVKSQVDLVRAAVDECILLNPGGDIGIDDSATSLDEGANKRYPVRPDSTRLPVAIRASDRLVRNIRCPGNPGDDPNHAAVFGGASGKFLPPAPDLFDEWQWYNGIDGIFFWAETDKTDAFLTSALEKLDEEYGECEVDVIDATTSAVNMNSDTDADKDIDCPTEHRCFRVWILAKGTPVFQAGSNEISAGCDTP